MRLPARVRVEVEKTAHQSRVVDLDTGETLKHVLGVHIEMDTRIHDKTTMVLVLEPIGIVMDGHPTYELREDALKVLCAQFGYELKKIEPAR